MRPVIALRWLLLALPALSMACAATAPPSSPSPPPPPALLPVVFSLPAPVVVPPAPPPAAPPTAPESLCQGGERAREVTALLHRAQELAPTRPEAHYNEGLWLMWVARRCEPRSAIPVMQMAWESFQRFLSLAASDASLVELVAETRQLMRDELSPGGGPIVQGIEAAEEAPPPAVWPGDLP